MQEEGEESAYLNVKCWLCQVSALVLGEGRGPALRRGAPLQSRGDAPQAVASHRESRDERQCRFFAG